MVHRGMLRKMGSFHKFHKAKIDNFFTHPPLYQTSVTNSFKAENLIETPSLKFLLFEVYNIRK